MKPPQHFTKRSNASWQTVRIFVALLFLAGCASPGGETPASSTRIASAPTVTQEATQPNTVAPTDLPTTPVSTETTIPADTAAASPVPSTTSAPSAAPSLQPKPSPQPTLTKPQASPTLKPSATPDLTAIALAQSPLKRKDTPPSGVAAQIMFGIGGFPPTCQFDQQNTDPGAAECNVEIATGSILEFSSFAPDSDLDVQIKQPDGKKRQFRLRTDQNGVAQWQWMALPGDPLGVYTVTVVQGNDQTNFRIRVENVKAPRLAGLQESFPAGESLRLVLAGFQPNQKIALRLYQRKNKGDDEIVYLTSLPPVQLNNRGQAVATLDTRAGDPKGDYVIIAANNIPSGFFSGPLFFFSVESQPQVQVTPKSGKAGSTFQISVSGLSQTDIPHVTLHLYRKAGAGYQYSAVLPTLDVDNQGKATYSWRTDTNQATGSYGVAARVGNSYNLETASVREIRATFEITAPATKPTPTRASPRATAGIQPKAR